ncbi:6-aminohexanoate hydrolase [Roseovarius sp. A46]|uniref:serine hydrolase domain-containing protein n=1 Tax=Roseovarius sp. A46 TaxID=2109331 RepID=UPI001011753B|nr:serine hydrolase [Roseovarius sp. A46]RXV64930.1 6-aminohexanoate hydrolase [Roseovarius sp. A46]
MRRILKWTGRVLLALVLAATVVGLWKREEITRLIAVNTLFSEEKIVTNFSGMERAFLTVPVPRGDGPVSDLPRGPEMTLPADVTDWVETRNVTSLLVLHNGRIRHESYHLGTTAQDRRISWSVAKSFLAALIGISLERGEIDSLDDPVTRYAPRLADSAYDGVTLRQLLQMTSGLEFDEDYLDYDSDINRMGRVLALGGSMDGFAAGLSARAAPPGTRWKYVSIDTHALAMALRGATGRALPGLLSERIIAPLGFESEPDYITDGEGVAFALGGLNLTTRDYARFGLMVAKMGRYGGQQIVPTGWIAASTEPSAPTPEGALQYGLHWWMPADAREGEFFAHGIYGQYIYIDRARDAVIVVTSADRGFREPGVGERNIDALRSIVAAL